MVVTGGGGGKGWGSNAACCVTRHLIANRRMHGRALLVTFDTENDARAHAEALTRDIQLSFKRLDKDVKEIVIGTGSGADEDAQVGVAVMPPAVWPWCACAACCKCLHCCGRCQVLHLSSRAFGFVVVFGCYILS